MLLADVVFEALRTQPFGQRPLSVAGGVGLRSEIEQAHVATDPLALRLVEKDARGHRRVQGFYSHGRNRERYRAGAELLAHAMRLATDDQSAFPLEGWHSAVPTRWSAPPGRRLA